MLRFEAFRTFAYERSAHAERLEASTWVELEAGSRIARRDYLDAKAGLRECRRLIAAVWGQVDLLLAPAAPGEAPLGLESTGEATFNRLWTGLLRAVPQPARLHRPARLAGRHPDRRRTRRRPSPAALLRVDRAAPFRLSIVRPPRRPRCPASGRP